MAEIKKDRGADGRSRTILEKMMGWNKRDLTPEEFKVHNPLKLRVGNSVNFDLVLFLPDLNYFVESVRVLETKVGSQTFYSTDYLLKGSSVDDPNPVRVRLRMIPDPDVKEIGHRLVLLRHYYECGWAEAESMNLHDGVLMHPDAIFDINYADDGTQLDEPMRFWRVGDERPETVGEDGIAHRVGSPLDPYRSKVTTLKDADGNGEVEEDELERSRVTWWDYHRQTEDPDTDLPMVESVVVEMDDSTRFFTFLRGRGIEPFQVLVI